MRHAGEYDSALAQHEAALSIVEELAEERWAAQYLNSYAATHQAAGNSSEALRLYRSALALAVSTGFGHEEALARQGIASLSPSR